MGSCVIHPLCGRRLLGTTMKATFVVAVVVVLLVVVMLVVIWLSCCCCVVVVRHPLSHHIADAQQLLPSPRPLLPSQLNSLQHRGHPCLAATVTAIILATVAVPAPALRTQIPSTNPLRTVAIAAATCIVAAFAVTLAAVITTTTIALAAKVIAVFVTAITVTATAATAAASPTSIPSKHQLWAIAIASTAAIAIVTAITIATASTDVSTNVSTAVIVGWSTPPARDNDKDVWHRWSTPDCMTMTRRLGIISTSNSAA